MSNKNFKIIKSKEIEYKLENVDITGNSQYAEIEISRDRSSFAGIGFEVTPSRGSFTHNEVIETIIEEVSQYDRLRVGMEKYYVDKLKEIYLLEDRNFGIEILFLIYSDVRSSEMIFKQLFEKMIEKIESDVT